MKERRRGAKKKAPEPGPGNGGGIIILIKNSGVSLFSPLRSEAFPFSNGFVLFIQC